MKSFIALVIAAISAGSSATFFKPGFPIPPLPIFPEFENGGDIPYEYYRRRPVVAPAPIPPPPTTVIEVPNANPVPIPIGAPGEDIQQLVVLKSGNQAAVLSTPCETNNGGVASVTGTSTAKIYTTPTPTTVVNGNNVGYVKPENVVSAANEVNVNVFFGACVAVVVAAFGLI